MIHCYSETTKKTVKKSNFLAGAITKVTERTKENKSCEIYMKAIAVYLLLDLSTAWKVSKCGVISGLHFPVFGPEITPQ